MTPGADRFFAGLVGSFASVVIMVVLVWLTGSVSVWVLIVSPVMGGIVAALFGPESL